MTTAETFSREADDDGSHYPKGWLEAIKNAVDYTEMNSINGDTRYCFEDGSAIVTTSGGWDVEGEEPFSWALAER